MIKDEIDAMDKRWSKIIEALNRIAIEANERYIYLKPLVLYFEAEMRRIFESTSEAFR